MNDKNLFETIKAGLFTAVVGNVLDTMGFTHQFLPPEIRPLRAGAKMVGRAMPALEADYPPGGRNGPLSDRALGVMFAALDDLKPDEIYIASGASFDYALCGGLMSTRAMHLKAVGAILNGYVRDSVEIARLGFDVFSRGVFAQDQGVRGKVLDYRLPLKVGNTVVAPGDLIFADDEGVLVIPRHCEQEAVERALEKAAAENKVAEAIKAGMGAQEAFETFGVM